MIMSTINGTELGAQEWRGSLFLRCGIEPPDLPEHCDGCGTAFDISHALDCKKGGLVTARHNDLRDGVADLASKAFTSTYVHDDPKIYTVHAMHGGKDKLKGSSSQDVGKLKGGLLIRDLWIQGTDSIHDMRVVNTDATSYQSKSPEKCLEIAEKAKIKKYIDACLKQR